MEYALYMAFRAFALDGAYAARDIDSWRLVLIRWCAFVLVMSTVTVGSMSMTNALPKEMPGIRVAVQTQKPGRRSLRAVDVRW